VAAGAVSIPSSSGHVFDRHKVCGKPPRKEVSIPSSSGHVFDQETKGERNERPTPFQSPRHRGTSSTWLPSSPTTDRAPSFNPLVIGARLRPGSGDHPGPRAAVSIPSSSGHVFDPTAVACATTPRASFNPLVIGARLRPRRRLEIEYKREGGGFNPLVIGARLRPTKHIHAKDNLGCEFQSPRHRGTSSTALPAQMDERRIGRFNPLVIGARLRPRSSTLAGVSRGRFQSPRHRGTSSTAPTIRNGQRFQPTVSIPSSSGHVFDHLPGPHAPDARAFQSPRHRGTSSTRAAARLGAAGGWGFNPLVIGARLRPHHLVDRLRFLVGFQSPRHRGTSST